MTVSEDAPVETINAHGASPVVLVCDHASRRLPERYGTMALSAEVLASHVAWDPGAMAVSRLMVDRLDAPLVASTVSRLVIDCNRALDAPDLIWTLSESVRIPANEDLGAQERAHRIETVHSPFHAAIDALLDRRSRQETILVCLHSFTPVYRGQARPWPAGLIHGRDARFTEAVHEALSAAAPGLDIGWNEPYAASDGVTYTLERHGDARGLPAVMVEIRNDEIADAAGVALWAERLAAALLAARGQFFGHGHKDGGREEGEKEPNHA